MQDNKMVLDSSIQRGRKIYQKDHLDHIKEHYKKKDFVDVSVKNGKSSTKRSNINVDISKYMSNETLKSRKKIVPFEFKEKEIQESFKDGDGVDDYALMNDNSLVLDHVYQSQLKKNTEETKKLLDSKK